MGITPETFYALTPAEFVYAWIGYADKIQTEFHQAWECTRWQAWVLTSIQLDRKDRRPMGEMFPLPWEALATPTENKKPLTMSERMERVNQILNRK